MSIVGIVGTWSNVATSYKVEPAIVQAIDPRARANSVLLGEPPIVRELGELLSRGVAAISRLAVLPLDAEAEARFERLLAAKRGTPVKVPLKAK